MLTRLSDVANPLLQWLGEMDRLLSGVLDGISPWAPVGWLIGSSFPPVNLWEDEGNIYAEAELPGLKMEDLEILVSGCELTLKGERKEEGSAEAVYHRRERGVGAFSRVLRLPVNVDADKVEAVLDAGVLTLKLPKSEAARLRKIKVTCPS